MEHFQKFVTLMMLTFCFSSASWAVLVCQKAPKTPKAPVSRTESLNRAGYFSSPAVVQQKIMNNIFQKNILPNNLCVEDYVPMNKMAKPVRDIMTTILADINDQIGFYYENDIRVRVLRNEQGDIWAFLVSNDQRSRIQDLAIYSMIPERGRYIPRLTLSLVNQAIL